MTIEPWSWSLAEAGRSIREGEMTSRGLTELMLTRIAEIDPTLRCFIHVNVDAALTASERADAELMAGHCRGPLHGVPLAHKDIFDRPGRITTCGTLVQECEASTLATVLARLQASGAIDLGALNMDEFAAGDVGDNPNFGRCRNPWNINFVTGGSSGGSAAAVAARLAFGSLGADTGGSIRQPAASCGIVGLKPTYGRVSRYGAAPRSWSVDCIGPMARTVEDCAILLQAIAGADPQDPTTGNMPVPDYASALDVSLRGRSVAIAGGSWFEDISPEIAGSLRDAVLTLRDLGACTRTVEIPDLPLLTDLQQVVVKCEAATLHCTTLKNRPDDISARVRAVLYDGYFIPAPRYIEALALRTSLLERHVREVFAEADVLIAPISGEPVPAFKSLEVGVDTVHEIRFSRSARFTRFANYLGTPSLAVPSGFTSDGLPLGLQLLGRPYCEADILSVGHAYLQAAGWHNLTPPLDAERLQVAQAAR